MSEVRPESLRKYLPKLYQERVELVGVNGLGGERARRQITGGDQAAWILQTG